MLASGEVRVTIIYPREKLTANYVCRVTKVRNVQYSVVVRREKNNGWCRAFHTKGCFYDSHEKRTKPEVIKSSILTFLIDQIVWV